MSTQLDTAIEIPEVIDLERLLAPVDGGNPAGESLQYAGVYDEIREARRADEQLAQGEWKRENKLADWDTVVSLADDALATRTKDLQIAAWYAEALVKQEGFPGLRDALKLARQMLERFWDELYPENDEDDYEARANAFAWMDRQLAAAIKEVPITEGTGGLRYTAHDWEDSKRFDIPEDTSNLDSTEIQKFSDLKEQAQTEGKITSEQWRVAKNTTRRAFYERTYAILNESWTEFQALDLEMDNRFGSQTPGLGVLRKSLDEIRTLIEKLVREKRIEEPDAIEVSDAAQDADNSNGDGVYLDNSANGTATVFKGAIRTRQEAFDRLAEVSRFFRQTEPHSPVPYLVERAIKWGALPLEKWLAEVVKSEDIMLGVRDTLGIKEESSDSGYDG